MRWFYLFRFSSSTALNSAESLWTAGNIVGVPSGSEFRRLSATVGGVTYRLAGLLMPCPDGQAPAFDQRIPTGAQWQLLQSGPVQEGEDPFPPGDVIAAMLPSLGAVAPVVFP